jgi:uncharacterized membrane protein
MDTSTTTPTPPPVSTAEDKTVAIVSYLTLIGFIAAIIIHSSKKTKLGAFHLRQTLGIFLTWFAVVLCEFVLFVIPILGWLCILALWLCVAVLWITGFIAALNGQMKPVPVLGTMYQKWFANVFD